MSAQVQPEETQAILSLMGSAPRQAEVSERDFTLPRRLSEARHGELTRAVEGIVPDLERALSAGLGCGPFRWKRPASVKRPAMRCAPK